MSSSENPSVVRNVLFCLYLLAGLFDTCWLGMLLHMCMHLKLCISQSVDFPDDRPSSFATGFALSTPSVFTPDPASRHRVEYLDGDERAAAQDFMALETTDLPLVGGIFLPEMCHNQLSTHAATNKLIAAVSIAQVEDKQHSVDSPRLQSPASSTMECVTAPQPLAENESAQVESSAIASQATAPLPSAGKKSAQVESSAIASQATVPLPSAGKKSAQVESSAIASQDKAPLPSAGKKSA